VRNSSQLPVRDVIGTTYLRIGLLTEERRGNLFSLALREGWGMIDAGRELVGIHEVWD